MESYGSVPYSQQLSSAVCSEQHKSTPKPRIQISIYTVVFQQNSSVILHK